MSKYAKGAVLVVSALAFAGITAWTFVRAQAYDHMKVGIMTSQERVALGSTALSGGEVLVSSVRAPEDAWLVVHAYDEGMPGDRIGVVRVFAGESDDVRVVLDEPVPPSGAMLSLHADRGERGVLEFSMDRFKKSPDKPFYVGLEKVAVMVER